MRPVALPQGPGAPGSVRVLVVDDHDALRAGLARLLGAVAGWAVVDAADGPQALQRLAEDRFDVAVVDMSMPGMSGFELIERIRREGGVLPILMLSMHDEEPYALRAVRAGAQGYLMKDRIADELVPALRHLLDGGMHLAPALAARLRADRADAATVAPHARLSDRELVVLGHLSRGLATQDVAHVMGLSEVAVTTSIERAQSKLRLPTLAGLVRYGIEHGLAATPPAPTTGPSRPLPEA